jgi:hypothetical protein
MTMLFELTDSFKAEKHAISFLQCLCLTAHRIYRYRIPTVVVKGTLSYHNVNLRLIINLREAR